MTEKEIRSKMVKTAAGYIGIKEADKGDDIIIEKYNNISPEGSYKMTDTDPWCAAFASVVANESGCNKIIPIDCSCNGMIAKFKEFGDEHFTNDKNYVPKAADYIFYDWDPEKNNGSEHVGIVEKVSGKTITVIEGNKDDACGRRTITVGYEMIEGYGLPDYASLILPTTKAAVKSSPAAGAVKAEEKDITNEVYTVKKGDTLSKIAKKYNTTYQAIAKFNCMSNMDGIDEGQKLKIPKVITYTVKNGDSLWKIADSLLGNGRRFEEIKSLNGMNSTIVKAGQVLKIPVNA